MVLDLVQRKAVTVTPGFDGPDFRPVVYLTCAASDFQMALSLNQAQRLAFEMAEATQAALADAFLFTYLQQGLGLEPKSAHEALDSFRQLRQSFFYS